MIAFFVAGYFGVGHAVDPSRAGSLATSVDSAIPFVPSTIFVYLGVFPAALLPLFTVRSRRLFRRILAAYAITIAVSLAIFVIWPVTSTGLRADPAALDATRFTGWCVRLVYDLDPPYNLFPSLHLSIAALAAGSLFKARRAYGILAGIGVAAIGVSICTVKQHFVADGLAGIALAAVVHAVVLRPFRAEPSDGPLAYSWRGPATYAAFHSLVYAGLYAAFVVG